MSPAWEPTKGELWLELQDVVTREQFQINLSTRFKVLQCNNIAWICCKSSRQGIGKSRPWVNLRWVSGKIWHGGISGLWTSSPSHVNWFGESLQFHQQEGYILIVVTLWNTWTHDQCHQCALQQLSKHCNSRQHTYPILFMCRLEYYRVTFWLYIYFLILVNLLEGMPSMYVCINAHITHNVINIHIMLIRGRRELDTKDPIAALTKDCSAWRNLVVTWSEVELWWWWCTHYSTLTIT